MTADFPTATVPTTPEYLLDVFRDWHEILVEYGEVKRDRKPSFETPVDQVLKDWCDDLNMVILGREYGESVSEFVHEMTRPEFLQLFPIGTKKTVRELCDYLATRMPRRVIRPWQGLGTCCLPAGAFLTVRSLLIEAGEDPKAVTPSTELEPVLKRHGEIVVGKIKSLAPMRMRELQIRTGISLGCLLFAAGILGMAILSGTGFGVSFLVLISGLALWILEYSRRSVGVDCGSLRTFRDLAYCLAGESPRARK